MLKNTFQPRVATLRHASSRMLNRYAQFADYFLTITFREDARGYLPNDEQVHVQIRHMLCTLNSKVWKYKAKLHKRYQILFIPIVEGQKTITRTHVHILLGNCKSAELVHEYMRDYIPRSNWLALRYDLRDVYAFDGLTWYVAKEVDRYNDAAVAWELAGIPPRLLP